MTAAIVDLQFDQGIGRPVVIANLTDAAGNLQDLTGCGARLQIRSVASSPTTLYDKSTAAGTMTVSTTFGVVNGNTVVTGNSITAEFTDADAASMQPPPAAFRPITAFPDEAPTYRLGVWECRLFASGGAPSSIARGSVFVTLSVVRTTGVSQ